MKRVAYSESCYRGRREVKEEIEDTETGTRRWADSKIKKSYKKEKGEEEEKRNRRKRRNRAETPSQQEEEIGARRN